jgi:arginyl-tRNA synthetase
MEIYGRIANIARDTLAACAQAGVIPAESIPTAVPIEKPKRAEHGDFATNICLQLAKPARKNPRDIAKAFLMHLADPDGLIEKVEIAGPGFVNFRVQEDVWRQALRSIHASGENFGRSDTGSGKRVLVEFVSANPTGPLHVGHGRGAVIGDVVSSLLDAAGYEVEREYYINDVGNQMRILGHSLFVRYQQACGRDIPFPENHYQGAYVADSAHRFKEAHGDAYLDHDYDSAPDVFIDFAKGAILEEIRRDLDLLGVRFDRWFSERTLHDAGRLHQAIDALRENGHVRTDDEGKVWFNSTAFGDQDDRVVMRETGIPTYFAADIAYHVEKFERGYDQCIDVWGADHHGYVPRVKAAIEALGDDPDRLEILLYQFVNLVEDGEKVKMSTRSGTFETLSDLVEMVGVDATRTIFLMRQVDAQFSFDLKLARQQSKENPVFKVQYGHARMCAIMRKAIELGYQLPDDAVDLSALTLPEELALIKRMLEFPRTVAAAAKARAPHYIVHYITETSEQFHSYYEKYKHTERVVSDDATKTAARLYLCDCLRLTLRNALTLIGVTAPESMYHSE